VLHHNNFLLCKEETVLPLKYNAHKYKGIISLFLRNVLFLLFISLRHFTVWEYSGRNMSNLGKVLRNVVLETEKFVVQNEESSTTVSVRKINIFQ